MSKSHDVKVLEAPKSHVLMITAVVVKEENEQERTFQKVELRATENREISNLDLITAIYSWLMIAVFLSILMGTFIENILSLLFHSIWRIDICGKAEKTW